MGLLSIVKSVKVPAPVLKLAIGAKKHAPEILVITGAVTLVGSAVVACKQTLKAHDILEKANSDLEDVEKALAENEPDIYNETDARDDRRKVYLKTGWQLIKCYGPSIVGGAIGLGMIFGGHNLLRVRNAALTVVYTNLLKSYQAYRERIVKEFDGNTDRVIASGGEFTNFEVTDDETGETKTVTTMIMDDETRISPYARIFEATNNNWSDNPSANLFWLQSQEKFANQKLRADGFLFLNDVYQSLGFPRTSDGQVVGWVYNPDDANHEGDNYVDFGIYDLLHNGDKKVEFINGYEPCIWLDFNVDGVVYDLI